MARNYYYLCMVLRHRYYHVDIWVHQCPTGRPCKPVARINNTALTDFDPATFPNPAAGSTNGDGSFTYPGQSPCASFV